MPELPDLVYIRKKLEQALIGVAIQEVVIREPIVLRVLVHDSIDASLLNASFTRVYRHGPFLGFVLDNNLELVIHPMLAGRFMLAEPADKKGRGLCFTFGLSTGQQLHYLDDKKMGKVYLLAAGKYDRIPRYNQQGVDIMSEQFTLEHFRKLIDKQRKQVRVFLMDQTRLSAIGNAYADEILFEAGLHPKTFCYQLSDEEIDRLYHSIKSVMHWGIAEVEKAAQPLEVKVRGHVKVRNRKDQPCKRCGNPIKRAGVLGYDAFFCPNCQPPARRQFIDWR